MGDNAVRSQFKAGIEETLINLLQYCKENGWAGFDPYDALNSRLYARMPFSHSPFISLVVTQLMKRLPFNLRPLLSVPKEQSSKGISLFLMALLKLERLSEIDGESLIETLVERVQALRSPNTSYWCWGYSFPWKMRKGLVPRGAPNLVCTCFVSNALFDLYERNRDSHTLDMALSAAEYILNELYWTGADSMAGFSYPQPSSRTRVHNANFLGSALLCRAYRQSGEKKFLGPALRVARYSASKQCHDGSWAYGELPTQRWVDNFHTGYNLVALRCICQYAETSEFEPHIVRGFGFYRKHFFRSDNAPKYFHDRLYPIDAHSVAQSIITLLTLEDLDQANVELAHAVYRWAMSHMWDERGFFCYQVLPFFTNRIPYMRWTQAWMLLALSYLLEKSSEVRQVGVSELK